MPAAAFLGREGRPERGRQPATAVLKTSSMLLGGIQGKKNQTPDETKQPSHHKTALREVSGTVFNMLPGSKAWLPAAGKGTRKPTAFTGPSSRSAASVRAGASTRMGASCARGSPACLPARERHCRGSPCPDGEAGAPPADAATLPLCHLACPHRPLTRRLLPRLSWGPDTGSDPETLSLSVPVLGPSPGTAGQ